MKDREQQTSAREERARPSFLLSYCDSTAARVCRRVCATPMERKKSLAAESERASRPAAVHVRIFLSSDHRQGARTVAKAGSEDGCKWPPVVSRSCSSNPALRNIKKTLCFILSFPVGPERRPQSQHFRHRLPDCVPRQKEQQKKSVFCARLEIYRRQTEALPRKKELDHVNRNTSGCDLHLAGREKILSHPIH